MKAITTIPSQRDTVVTPHTKIVGLVQKDGRTYFRSSTSYDGLFSFEYSELLRKDEHALYATDDGLHAVEQIKYTLPLKVGAKGRRVHNGQDESYSVVGQESVEINGKTYADCYRIVTVADFQGGTYTSETWVAPNIGPIKAVKKGPTGGVTVEVLKEFKAGKTSSSPAAGKGDAESK